MVYGKYCPMCRQPFYSVQRGSGVISTVGDVAKRAMARELGKKMAAATMKVQRYGNRQKGSGALTDGAVNLLKTIVRSAPVREAGSAALGALTNRAIAKLSPPKNKKKKRSTKRGGKPPRSNKRMTVSQTGGLAPVLLALIAAAPLIAKTIGLAGLGSLTSYGVQKALPR